MKRKGDDGGVIGMKSFDEEYQAKNYYIHHRVVVESSQKERVRLISTHTHTLNQTLYYILKKDSHLFL